jgi:hypothetical protein
LSKLSTISFKKEKNSKLKVCCSRLKKSDVNDWMPVSSNDCHLSIVATIPSVTKTFCIEYLVCKDSTNSRTSNCAHRKTVSTIDSLLLMGKSFVKKLKILLLFL